MRGIIKLPVEKGRKELAWYAGSFASFGTNELNPVVSMKVEKDADFVVKRLWLVQWPSSIITVDPALLLPPRTTGFLRDGGTKRGLALTAGNVRSLFWDADPARMNAAWLGLPAPFLVKANNNLFVELANPDAAGTAWTGDLYLVAEGFKVYPYLPEEFPATIQSYAVPFHLDGVATIASPAAAPVNVTGQGIAITNNGEGKFLAKGMRVTAIDAGGVDRSAAILPFLGFNVVDSTSGSKRWVQNTNQGIVTPFCPASLMTMQNLNLPWNTPRYIDQNGTMQVQVVFPSQAAVIAYLNGLVTWPLTVTVDIFGALLPR